MSRKMTYRFSIQISAKTEHHKKIIDYLEQLGRKKGAFIVEAIDFYLNNSDNLKNDKTIVRYDDEHSIKELLKSIMISIGNFDDSEEEKSFSKPKPKKIRKQEKSKELNIDEKLVDDALDSLDSWGI